MSHQGPYGPPPTAYQQPPAPYGYAPGYPMQPIWTCRHCGAAGTKFIYQKISTGGWVLFSILLLGCFPLCWIGLMIKDQKTKCSHCGTDAV